MKERVWLALTFADTCQLTWDNISCCMKQNKERCQQSVPLCHFREIFPLQMHQCVQQNHLDMLRTICWLISLFYNHDWKQNLSCYIIYLLLPVCPINHLKWSYEIDKKKNVGLMVELFEKIEETNIRKLKKLIRKIIFRIFSFDIDPQMIHVSSLLLCLHNVSLHIC